MALEAAGTLAGRGEAAWLVELAPLPDGDHVAQAAAVALDVEGGPDPLESLCGERERLGRRLRPLAVPDESLRAREELARVESVQLLLDRARALNPDLDLAAEDVESVVRICRALDGIPLAIELAAGRLRSVSFAELAARLDNQVSVLARSRSTTPDEERHRTLRMTFDWSYDLLSDEQQMLARWLSVFAGGFRLDAVESLCRGRGLDVLDAVDELVAKSLVTFDPATARYRLLEPLRQYLALRLDEAGETDDVQRAHARAVAHLCDRLGFRLLDDQRRRSRRLREEAGNIDLALHWATDHDHGLAVRLVGALGLFWYFYDQVGGHRWCEPVLALTADVAPLTRAQALTAAGMVAQNEGEWERSEARLREALALFRAADSAFGEAASLFLLGVTLATPWNPEHRAHQAEARQRFEESHRLYAQIGDWVGAGWSRLLLAQMAFPDEDLDRTEQLVTQVIDDCTAAGAHHPVPQALSVLAFIACRRDRAQEALDHLQDAAAVSRELDDPAQLADVLANMSAQQIALGRSEEAEQTLVESARLLAQVHRGPGRCWPLAAAAVLHLARGEPALATRALGAYDAHTPLHVSVPGEYRGYSGILAEAVDAARARLDEDDIATAAAAARRLRLDQLVDELILQAADTPA
jgi:predicted ATPase